MSGRYARLDKNIKNGYFLYQHLFLIIFIYFLFRRQKLQKLQQLQSLKEEINQGSQYDNKK